MIDKLADLEVLRKSREVLERSYVKWISDDGHDGHCAMGAVEKVGGAIERFNYLTLYLDPAARALHPELKGAVAKREIWQPDLIDQFDIWPTIYVNNHTDKETTLAVFDAAILRLEMEIAKETPVPVAQATTRDLVAV